jgi:phage gp36-like protein
MTIAATLEEFVLAYDDLESVILSDPDNLDTDLQGLGLTSNDRIQLALDDAYNLQLSFYIRALPIGRAMIKASWKRDQMQIARYLLDTVKARQPVKESYTEVMARLEKAASLEDNIQLTKEEQIELGIDVKQGNNLKFQSGARTFTQESLQDYREGNLFYR